MSGGSDPIKYMNKKDLLTLSLTIVRHTFGVSFWKTSEPKKDEEDDAFREIKQKWKEFSKRPLIIKSRDMPEEEGIVPGRKSTTMKMQ